MIACNQQFITKEQASFTELLEHQEAIILDLESLHYYSLNAAATLLWKHLRSGSANTLAALAQQIAAVFSVSPVNAERDTQAFLETLITNQLITPSEGETFGRSSFTMPEAGALTDYEPPCLKTSASVLREMNLAGSSSMGGPGALG